MLHRLPRPHPRISRADVLFCLAVVVAYAVATRLAIDFYHQFPDRMMVLAERIAAGHLDSPSFANTNDSVAVGGRYYMAIGPLQAVPYLAFVPFPGLHDVSAYLVSLAFGIPAAWLSLPLARAYGARGTTALWIAVFVAFGSLLFYVSVFGDFYYLAHAEAFLATTLLLLEWAGRRRPFVLGLLFGMAFLARPTTILAVAPFGAYLLWSHRDGLWSQRDRLGSRRGPLPFRRDGLRAGIALAVPVLAAIAAYGAFNWARFGSPLEAGYASSLIFPAELIYRRSLGIFSIRQIPENLRLALLQGFLERHDPPYISADLYGTSMLFVSPALLASLRAGFRSPTARLMWAAAGLVAVPVLLYYGGGFVQYGFRYSLDFTPFLVALMALGSGRWLGRLERTLILISVVSVGYGVLWHAHVFP